MSRRRKGRSFSVQRAEQNRVRRDGWSLYDEPCAPDAHGQERSVRSAVLGEDPTACGRSKTGESGRGVLRVLCAEQD
jgi:hypothetical protein